MLELHRDLAQAYSVVDDYADVEACSVHVAVSDALFYLCPRLVDHRGGDLHETIAAYRVRLPSVL